MVVQVPGGVRREDLSAPPGNSQKPQKEKEVASLEGSLPQKKEPTKEEIVKGLLKPLPMLNHLRKKGALDVLEEKGIKFLPYNQQPISDKFDLSEGVSVLEGNRTRSNFRPNQMSMTTTSDFSKNNKITKKAYAMMMTQQGAFSSNSINESLQEKRASSEKKLTFQMKAFGQQHKFGGKEMQASSLPLVGPGNGSQYLDDESRTLREEEKSRNVHIESGELFREFLEKAEEEEDQLLKGGKQKEVKLADNKWISGNDEFNRGLVENRTEGNLNKPVRAFKISDVPKPKMERSTGSLLHLARQRGHTAGVSKAKQTSLPRLPPPKFGKTFGHGFFEQST